jgi:hypothetical protein
MTSPYPEWGRMRRVKIAVLLAQIVISMVFSFVVVQAGVPYIFIGTAALVEGRMEVARVGVMPSWNLPASEGNDHLVPCP